MGTEILSTCFALWGNQLSFFSVSHTVCPFLSSEWAEDVDAYLSTGRLNKQLFECY